LKGIDWRNIRRVRENALPSDVAAVIRTPRIADTDLPRLLAPAAEAHLEEMAQRAAALTAHRFGKVVQLYAPLYLSNECVNDCTYCGFARRHKIDRRTLSVTESLAEADVLWREGFRHILLVSGEAPHAFTTADLAIAVEKIAPRFAGIGIEVFPMKLAGYKRLEKAGVDNLTIYQETYDRELYAGLHTGPKADFDARLAALEAGGDAGFRTLGIGALLGLKDWREEVLAVLLHARYLTKRFWKSRVAVSFPRLCPAEGGFSPPSPVSDRDLVHMIVATRLALPDAEIVISTREGGDLRDKLIPLGVTRMSAGSKTTVGGYRSGLTTEASDQFSVHDNRPPAEVAQAIESAGREPVWKDFDEGFRH